MGSDSREGTKLGKGQTEYGMDGQPLRHQPHRAPVRGPAVGDRRVDPARLDDDGAANCKNKADKVENGVIRQWNQNFTLGGPACTIRTFEGLTGIFIDHFVVIDFRGFQSMVNALGGVTVCRPSPSRTDRATSICRPARARSTAQQRSGYVRLRTDHRRRVGPRAGSTASRRSSPR